MREGDQRREPLLLVVIWGRRQGPGVAARPGVALTPCVRGSAMTVRPGDDPTRAAADGPPSAAAARPYDARSVVASSSRISGQLQQALWAGGRLNR